MKTRLSAAIATVLVFGLIGGAVYSYYYADFSLVDVQIVNENSVPGQPSLAIEEVEELADLGKGSLRLVDLDVRDIQSRIRTNSWIRDVTVSVRFPKTLEIHYTTRRPVAILQGAEGNLKYLDRNGVPFGEVDLTKVADLPFVKEGTPEEEVELDEAVRLALSWQGSDLGKVSEVSSIDWHPETGYRVMVSYGGETTVGQVVVEVGQKFDSAETVFSAEKIQRLSHVLRYLVENKVDATTIYALDAKKIIVKSAKGS